MLIKLNYEWQLQSKDMKIKCRTIVENEAIADTNDDTIKEYLKNNFLKFYITIFKHQSKTKEDLYMLDVSLFRGTLLVFLDFFLLFKTEVLKATSDLNEIDMKSSQSSNSAYKGQKKKGGIEII